MTTSRILTVLVALAPGAALAAEPAAKPAPAAAKPASAPAATKPAPAPAAATKPAPAAPPRKADRPASVQAGVQALSDALASKLLATKAGYQRLAVLPFEALDPEAKTKELGLLSAELLSTRLASRPGILQVERSRLQAVIEELDRTRKGEISPDGAASVGKLLGANQVVLGSIAASGASYVLTARLVDAETGQVLAASDQDVPREGLLAFSEDVVEMKSPGAAALRSTAVPGWGQIYNGDSARGVAYITLAAAAAATAVTSAVLGMSAKEDYEGNTRDTVGRRVDANDHYDRVNIALVSLGGVWVTSIVDAWLTGKNVREVNLPPEGPGASAQVGP